MLNTLRTARTLLVAVAAVLALSAALFAAGAAQPARADTPITCEGSRCPEDPTTCAPAADLDAARETAAELHTEVVAAQTAAARSAQVAAEAQADLAKAKAKIERLRGRLAEARR